VLEELALEQYAGTATVAARAAPRIR
jgi:hypothetical protein